MSVLKRPRKRTYLAADDRRAQILDVARTVFARRGFHDANVAHICKAARIGRGTLYQYFDNKRDVLLGVVEEICARIARVLARRERPAPAAAGRKVPLPAVLAYCTARLRAILEPVFADSATLRLVLRDARGLDAAVDDALARVDALLRGAIEADLRAAARAGLLRRKIDFPLTALFFLGGVEKIVLAALAGKGPIDLDRIVRAAVHLELFGIMNAREERR